MEEPIPNLYYPDGDGTRACAQYAIYGSGGYGSYGSWNYTSYTRAEVAAPL